MRIDSVPHSLQRTFQSKLSLSQSFEAWGASQTGTVDQTVTCGLELFPFTNDFVLVCRIFGHVLLFRV